MNLKFIFNEYILIWNLLFRQSISKDLNDKKQKIWFNYKKEYNALSKDKKALLEDPKNYIPDDDAIYNIVKELDVYNSIYNGVEKYKVALTKAWDEVKKPLRTYLKEILKIDLNDYKIYVVDPRLNIMDFVKLKDGRVVIYGAKAHDDKSLILNLIYNIVHSEIGSYNKEYQAVVDAVLELMIKNEIATRLTNRSHYLDGDQSLSYLKKQIYPYFLMYMNIPKEKWNDYIKRDGVIYDINSFEYNEKLKDMNVFSFIDFCIKNQKYIVKIEELEIL